MSVRVRYYKNLLNRMRHDIRAAMGELDPLFFSFPKSRGRDVRGRDKLDWYKETDDIAQVCMVMLPHRARGCQHGGNTIVQTET